MPRYVLVDFLNKVIILFFDSFVQLGMGGTIKVVAAEEGVLAFWKGINAAWLRESSYTSLRLGLYEPIKVFMFVKIDFFSQGYTVIVARSDDSGDIVLRW